MKLLVILKLNLQLVSYYLSGFQKNTFCQFSTPVVFETLLVFVSSLIFGERKEREADNIGRFVFEVCIRMLSFCVFLL